jgi:hypothetical protein
VPAAAAVAVLIRFAISRYLASPLYTGELPPPSQASLPAPAAPRHTGELPARFED